MASAKTEPSATKFSLLRHVNVRDVGFTRIFENGSASTAEPG